jgi:hypothetical protein
MMLRPLARCAALVLGLLFSLSLGAPSADARDGSARPLDLMKFMQGKSAAKHATVSRRGTTHHGKPRHAKRDAARTHDDDLAKDDLAKTESAPATQPDAAPSETAKPAETAAAPAPAPAPDVQVVASGELNDIDRAAPAPAETNGLAGGSGQPVQMVGAQDFNAIDGQAAGATAPQTEQQADASGGESAVTTTSWLQGLWSSWSLWIWSSLSSAFTAVRDLFG